MAGANDNFKEPARFQRADGDEILQFVETLIFGFCRDRADTEFLKGYLFALTDVHEEFCGPERWVHRIIDAHVERSA